MLKQSIVRALDSSCSMEFVDNRRTMPLNQAGYGSRGLTRTESVYNVDCALEKPRWELAMQWLKSAAV